METDIPLPDELELLEADSHFYEDHLDPPSPDTYPHSPQQEPQQLLPQSPTAPEINGHNKRPRFDDPDSPFYEDGVPSDEKRSKIDDDVGPEIDHEDWLRPVQDRNGGDEEERVEVVVEEEEKEKIVSRYASEIDGDFIPVTAPSGGDRVYAKMCRVDMEEGAKKLHFKSQSNGLISEPINVLLQRMEQEAFTKALQASSEDQSDVILPETQVMHEQLWVDKYAPNSFTELLSDEQTNREVLLWLKQWDSSVFGSAIRSTSDDILSALRRHSSIAQHQKLSDSTFFSKNKGHKWSTGNFRHSNNLEQEDNKSKGIQDSWTKKLRPTGPPEQKILLLCGPPGLGKTTLAHIAAKHCGYRVVEINASDDRSSSTIEAKILDVVQMNSVMADSRPKCLVIDEIDGALGDGKGAVEVLLKMVLAERKADTGKENVTKGEQSRRITSKKGQKTATLARPEGMKTSSIALAALADYTGCDIRSCLNTLQFLNKKREVLNVGNSFGIASMFLLPPILLSLMDLEIGSQVVGRKDMSSSVFDIWKEVT
ncbi:unnamed protein product [Dovyalis caffra]|uniref:AAA+ ATPase domain-containing protein n=1 Tax=Dovyalis caffra TaxID=77055 RepID=A0AAV1RHM3_9ROSI|nr:unnamed protein product [Dovyalis caffra]